MRKAPPSTRVMTMISIIRRSTVSPVLTPDQALSHTDHDRLEKHHLALDESTGTRTLDQARKEVFQKAKLLKANLNLMPLDDINLIFN